MTSTQNPHASIKQLTTLLAWIGQQDVWLQGPADQRQQAICAFAGYAAYHGRLQLVQWLLTEGEAALGLAPPLMDGDYMSDIYEANYWGAALTRLLSLQLLDEKHRPAPRAESELSSNEYSDVDSDDGEGDGDDSGGSTGSGGNGAELEAEDGESGGSGGVGNGSVVEHDAERGDGNADGAAGGEEDSDSGDEMEYESEDEDEDEHPEGEPVTPLDLTSSQQQLWRSGCGRTPCVLQRTLSA